MRPSKWWKCDLQVATPAWDFKLPAGSSYDFTKEEHRQNFLDQYMEALKAKGIEVIALADHNTGEWIDSVKVAAERHGIIAFPGCEVTTHTGADGVHLVVIGDLGKTTKDFDRLIYGPLGFDQNEHRPFTQEGPGWRPNSSSKPVTQLLDDLPEDYLVFAPHALNDNGIASAKTVKGDLRWKSLHHERLSAVDPGNCAAANTDSFGDKFRRRSLDDFPVLPSLAFISCSDAYRLEDLGREFAWIRMGEPSLEALRQACLDHEARILCDWSPRLSQFPEGNPNNVRHAWISSVSLGGALGNSASPFSLEFHPNFNVIIGGRGSGKSTIVAALRSLYGTGENLPSRLQAEVGDFVDNVFLTAELKSSHYIQESQEIRQCQWTHSGGSETVMNGNAVLTNFPVTVISQKELFERAAGDKNDPFLASHSLLALLDEGIGYGYSDAKSVGAWQRRVDDARNDWSNAVRTWIELTTDLNQLPAIKQQMATLQTQVDAFAAPEVTARVQRINARATERQFLKNEEELVRNLIRNATNTLSEAIAETPVPETLEGYADEFLKRVAEYRLIRSNLLTEGMDAIRRAEAKLESSKTNVEQTEWFKACEAASADHERYRQELEAKGLSSSEFSRLEGQLAQARENVKQLESKMGDLAGVQEQVADAWTALIRLYVERRNSRGAVLEAIRDRSGSLRFNLDVHADTTRWCERVREIAGLRSDAFLTEVPELAQWIWVREPDELERRWGIWRLAIATGDFEAIQTETRLRSSFFQRLAGLDMVIRLQLASELADDAVSMLFLKEGGRPETDGDWQSVTQGSPGQRTAAMLAFVLHHGREPLVLDQPEDDLDSEWISRLVVKELRQSRWSRQLIVVSHNANVPVLGDAEQITAMENRNGSIRIRSSTGVGVGGVSQEIPHVGPVEYAHVRQDIQLIMEGGVQAFVRRERRYHNETRLARAVE